MPENQISIDELMAIIGRKEVEKQLLIAENERLRQKIQAIEKDKSNKTKP